MLSTSRDSCIHWMFIILRLDLDRRDMVTLVALDVALAGNALQPLPTVWKTITSQSTLMAKAAQDALALDVFECKHVKPVLASTTVTYAMTENVLNVVTTFPQIVAHAIPIPPSTQEDVSVMTIMDVVMLMKRANNVTSIVRVVILVRIRIIGIALSACLEHMIHLLLAPIHIVPPIVQAGSMHQVVPFQPTR